MRSAPTKSILSRHLLLSSSSTISSINTEMNFNKKRFVGTAAAFCYYCTLSSSSSNISTAHAFAAGSSPNGGNRSNRSNGSNPNNNNYNNLINGNHFQSAQSTKVTNSRLFSTTTKTNSDETIPSSTPNLPSILTALSAVRKASRITRLLQPTTVSSEISGVTKKDASPVTIGDFASQALVLKVLEEHFPEDVLIAEEGSQVLDSDSDSDGGNNSLAEEIMNVIRKCGYTSILPDVDELKRSIDLGQTYDPNDGTLASTSSSGKNRRWCLDPIDGTRGFLRGKREGGQYCIALAMIEDGEPVVGILGCPNLPTSSTDDDYEWTKGETEENNRNTRGCVFVASKGGGCYQLPLDPPPPTDDDDDDHNKDDNNDDDDVDRSTRGAIRINTSPKDTIPIHKSRFCTGVETYGDPLGQISSIGRKLHGSLDEDGNVLHSRRMDSQVKYGVLARGGAEIFVRVPKESYVEWIWDHCAGRVVIEEAGGVQTDTENNLIDYGLGAKMDTNVNGIMASSSPEFHDKLLTAYREVVEERRNV